jgi:hypothetical protein
MKPYRSIVVSIILLTIYSCQSTRKVATDFEIQKLNTMVESKKFIIESEWAYPQTTNALNQVLNSGILQPGSNSASINLIGNSNFLKILGDSIYSHLPYFGERQMQVGYGGSGDGAIKLKGVMENYQSFKRKDNGIDISFEAKSNSENFNVNITIWPSLNANISLNSVSRFPIRYSGNAKEISENE